MILPLVFMKLFYIDLTYYLPFKKKLIGNLLLTLFKKKKKDYHISILKTSILISPFLNAELILTKKHVSWRKIKGFNYRHVKQNRKIVT